MTGLPIPTTVPITPLPPREPKPEWPGIPPGTVRVAADHTQRAQQGRITDREEGDVEP